MSRRLVELGLVGLLLSGTAQAAEDGDPAVIAIVDGTVTLAGGTPVNVGDKLALPVKIDARGGSVSLVFEGSGARVLGEGVTLRLHRANAGGVRLGVGDTRVDVPAGQSLHAKRNPERTPKVFLRTPVENTAAITIGSCQTLIRLLPGSMVSVELDKEGMKVTLQSEGGAVEAVGRSGLVRLLAGERLLDGCVPPPGEASVEMPEAFPPLTPFTP